MRCYILSAIRVFAFMFLGELCIRKALHSLLLMRITFVASACKRNSVTQTLGCNVAGEYLAMIYYFDAIF